MTEISADEAFSIAPELKSSSRIVVLLGSPDGLKGISKKLTSLKGVTRIRRGVFIVHEYLESHDMLLQFHSVISFSKTREIPTIREQSKNAYSDRVYTLVSFSYKDPTTQQKKYVERLIRKSTGIRLRPGVILFPLLRSKERRRIIGSDDEKVLIDSAEFARLVRMNGGDALRWSRLRISNLNGADKIEDAVQRTFVRDLKTIEERIQTLREHLKSSNTKIRQLKKNYTVLSRGYREVKTKWMLAKKLWLFDPEKALKRTYNMLINTRRAISSAEDKL
ncbi:MAG: hypothetical protein ACFFF9_01990 [Candidatus Thorarchaeota archaeon]